MRNNNSSEKITYSLGFLEALALIFITLKLCKIINWPWVWVLSPIWISIIIVIVAVVGFVIADRIEERKYK